MPPSVVVYQERSRRRSKVIGEAMFAGIRREGESVTMRMDSDYQKPDADVAVFYGMAGNLARIFTEYQKAGKTVVYIDLGYWGRRAGGPIGRWKGYHKVSVNARHPTAYFRSRPHDDARAKALGLSPRPWRAVGRHILVAGMGAKAATFEGVRLEEWERWAIAEIRQRTDRPIVYRPKPNCPQSRPIAGTGFSPSTQSVVEALVDCHAVVTHHSNVAIDGLLMGVPAFCWFGVAAPMALQDFDRIETPHLPDGREEWLNDITYTQFSVSEMAEGVAWRHLKSEGLVP